MLGSLARLHLCALFALSVSALSVVPACNARACAVPAWREVIALDPDPSGDVVPDAAIEAAAREALAPLDAETVRSHGHDRPASERWCYCPDGAETAYGEPNWRRPQWEVRGTTVSLWSATFPERTAPGLNAAVLILSLDGTLVYVEALRSDGPLETRLWRWGSTPEARVLCTHAFHIACGGSSTTLLVWDLDHSTGTARLRGEIFVGEHCLDRMPALRIESVGHRMTIERSRPDDDVDDRASWTEAAAIDDACHAEQASPGTARLVIE